MNFQDTLEYMYALLPMYQRVGKQAFKKDLTNTLKLCARLGNPHEKTAFIHIAGTNGKGSSAHMLASVLQEAGYKTGLYTSPHLKSFTERIRIDGREVEERYVVEFIENNRNLIEEIRPSFFELTVAMAFDYFARANVVIAVIETGLGGRFDSTNVITPMVSLITNIGLDHTDMLGDTLPQIAFEKAGIIKNEVPAVIGEWQPEVADVFEKKAEEVHAPLYFAEREYNIKEVQAGLTGFACEIVHEKNAIFIESDLGGTYQARNLPGVMKTLDILNGGKFSVKEEHIVAGLKNVVKNTGLLGRWQVLARSPLTICDTVHNEPGVKTLREQLEHMNFHHIFLIWGAVVGKDIKNILRHLPQRAFYYFCEPGVPRAMKAEVLYEAARELGLRGIVEKDVNKALARAMDAAGEEDLIFVGGSNFVVAEIKDLKK